MEQKRKTLVVSGVLGLIMIGAIALFAGNLAGCRYDGLGDSGFRPRFGHGGFHPGFMGNALPEFAAQRLDDHVEDLNLSDAQEQQYQNIRESFKELVTQHVAQRKEFFIQLSEAIQQPNPDPVFIGTLIKAHAQNIPEAIGSYVDVFLSFYDILDANQKGLVIEHAQERFKRMERFITSSRSSSGGPETAGGGEDDQAQD
jgi:hypothetical protein